MFENQRLGLVLSGGGARCIAHLGILKALEEAGFSFEVVSGVSAGALIGALYCKGFEPEEILTIIKETRFYSLLRPSFKRKSIISMDRARPFLETYLGKDDFSFLEKTLFITTTNLNAGKSCVFSSGSVITPLLASCSIPVLFDPILIDGDYHADGGVLDNLPVTPLRGKCDKIIALHCNPIEAKDSLGNWKNILERSMMMTIAGQVYSKRESCDLFIEPKGLSEFKVFDFKKADAIFNLGYEFTIDFLKG